MKAGRDKPKRKICVACNEDGFGPSALAYYVVREIVDTWTQEKQHDFDLLIIVLNNHAHDFNMHLYADDKGLVYPVRLKRDSLIRLEKPNGEVAIKENLKKLLDYDSVRKPYLNEVKPFLYGSDIAIDIGVPVFARAARELGVPHRITIFDHSWAKTLKLMCSKDWEHLYEYNPKPTDLDRSTAESISALIADDEKLATRVYLFDSYITPKPFVDHWKSLRGPNRSLVILQGVLGGTEKVCKPKQKARRELEEMLVKLGQEGIGSHENLVLISPGGTPVWTNILPTMVQEYLTGPERPYLPVLSNFHCSDEATTASLKNRMKKEGRNRIRWFDFVEGATQQRIMLAFDLIVTRAGGGTVNDALAAKVPFWCVEEPQVQVKLIEQACFDRHLIPETGMKQIEFEEAPSDNIDGFFARRAECKIEIGNVPAGVERGLADDLLGLLDQ